MGTNHSIDLSHCLSCILKLQKMLFDGEREEGRDVGEKVGRGIDNST